VPEDRFLEGAGATVVEVSFAAADAGGEADAPERRRAPFGTGGVELTHVVRQAGTHVVQEQIGIRMDGLAAEFGHGMERTGGEARRVARGALSAGEKLLALESLGIGQVAAGDINGDKKPDVVEGNKRGTFVFLRK